MDCERFDRIVLDFLYDELDELTAAAARRHLEQCARCRGIVAGLRATREVGTLPLVDPPDGLELRILEAERQMRGRLPLRQRAGRAVSVLAGYAMRPQLAMAALLLLAIGGGLVFFRQRPNERDSVSITERGVAESDPEPQSVLPKAERAEPLAAAPPPRAAPSVAALARENEKEDRASAKSAEGSRAPTPVATGMASASRDGEDSVYQAALGAYRAGRYAEARQEFEAVVAQGDTDAAQAAYYAAASAKNGEGCGVAAALFDQVSQHYPGTAAGYDATWEAAGCYRTLGDSEKARRAYQALLDEGGYMERARTAIAELDRADGAGEVAARQRQQVAAAPAAPPPPPKAKASARPAPGNDGAGSRPKSAPTKGTWRTDPAF